MAPVRECYTYTHYTSPSAQRARLGKHPKGEVAFPEFQFATVGEALCHKVASMKGLGNAGPWRLVVSRYRVTDRLNEEGANYLEHLDMVGLYDVTPSGYQAVTP